MPEYIENDAFSADGCADVNKIKTPFTKIIVDVYSGKPYYSIMWLDTTKNEYIIGYSSFCLEYVVKWFEEQFEIVEDDKTPAGDVAPVRHGKWIKRKSWDFHVCSECSFETSPSKYCPNCGAKMDRGDKNDE